MLIALLQIGNTNLMALVLSVFDTSLTWQYRIAVGKMGLTKQCILQTLNNSVNSAFVDDGKKSLIRASINEYVDAHFNNSQQSLNC